MPPNRIEPTALGPDSVSPAAPAPASAPASAGGLKAWLPLAITVAVMPVLAYATTTLVLVPKLQKSLAVAAAGEAGEGRAGAAGNKKQAFTMNKLLVNVAGTMGSRYLLVSLTLSGSDPEFRARIQEFDPQMRDMACSALSAKTLVDLEKPTARNLIRTELITGFNNILGEMLVQDIYFTEFAIQ